jgi:exopolyphosphatase/guanosine-5'-triphosphate,3'-diphosphate pyrophosphatase
MKKHLLVNLTVLILAACSTAPKNPCLEIRGALDIGTGSTKAYAAEVDVCRNEIVRPVFDQKTPIAFGEQRQRSGQNEIPIAFVGEASAKIRPVIDAIKNLGAVTIGAVATAAFRDAKNGPAAAQALSGALEVPVRVISQKEEAQIGARSAFVVARIPESDRATTIVWDIGGGSMQMIHQAGREATIFTGDLASVTFKNRVIAEIQKKNPKTVSTPNPLGKGADAAVGLAAKHAQENVPSAIREISKSAKWLGLGGVLAVSVQRQVNPSASEFHREPLEEALRKRKSLADEEIGGDYRTTEVTNLALVLGYMNALGIDKVATAEASLVQGLVVPETKNRK